MATKSEIKAAIFDMDGLLIDSERIIMQACIQAAKAIGITYTQAEFVALIGRSSTDASRLMAVQLNGVEQLSQVAEGVDAILKQRNYVFPLKPGALTLLQHFQANNVICGVASSSPISHIQHRLSHVGVLDYFASITSGQEVAKGKPSPDIYWLAAERLGVAVDACIAFEDSETGARAAIAAGLKVIVVPDLQLPSDFVREKSVQVLASLDGYVSAKTSE
ncbi:MAG: HAD family phosphatase [Methylophilaceae bacterium]|nr:HAD family phosphatase [Methylophilaceae bacterium]MDG1444975.1 HAD family phosphatase [Methylophilaceae bacterium]MDG1820318.1 HAD family phosphatase [Methylophilaceae bacterium]